MASWWELEIHTSEEASEAVADMLMRNGAEGVATEDPDEISRLVNAPDTLIFTDPQFLKALPDYVRLRGYFSAESETALQSQIAAELEVISSFLDIGKGIVACQKVHESDWAETWKAHYHPIKVSSRIVIRPTWEAYEAENDEIVIALDPGSAFGTGEHASTILCLQVLDETATEGNDTNQLPLSQHSILDLGCGSGVLAIAAAKLGATFVDAIDIDPNAIEVASDNILQNDCQDLIRSYSAELSTTKEKTYSFIIANILADVHIDLVNLYYDKLEDSGILIIGGIIDHKVEKVKDVFAKKTFELLEEKQMEEWFVLKYRK